MARENILAKRKNNGVMVENLNVQTKGSIKQMQHMLTFSNFKKICQLHSLMLSNLQSLYDFLWLLSTCSFLLAYK
jgi:hypothetical protein